MGFNNNSSKFPPIYKTQQSSNTFNTVSVKQSSQKKLPQILKDPQSQTSNFDCQKNKQNIIDTGEYIKLLKKDVLDLENKNFDLCKQIKNNTIKIDKIKKKIDRIFEIKNMANLLFAENCLQKKSSTMRF